MKTPNPNITQIRTTLGAGPVREERKPGATGKKRGVAGKREAEARRQREETQAAETLDCPQASKTVPCTSP